jgi:hypothetical protein
MDFILLLTFLAAFEGFVFLLQVLDPDSPALGHHNPARLLVQEARRLGIKVSPEELNQAISDIKTDYPGEEFGEKLGLKGMSLEATLAAVFNPVCLARAYFSSLKRNTTPLFITKKNP